MNSSVKSGPGGREKGIMNILCLCIIVVFVHSHLNIYLQLLLEHNTLFNMHFINLRLKKSDFWQSPSLLPLNLRTSLLLLNWTVLFRLAVCLSRKILRSFLFVLHLFLYWLCDLFKGHWISLYHPFTYLGHCLQVTDKSGKNKLDTLPKFKMTLIVLTFA